MKKVNRFYYSISKFILSPLFILYYNPKFIGTENIPKDGPLIFVGNHKHIMDQNGPIVCYKRPIRYMAKKEYFEGKFSWFFKANGCIPVDRSKKDKSAVNEALKELRRGGCIGLFPEGTRNKTKLFLLPFKFGAVSMAKKTKATLVPFSVTGDYKFRSKNLVYNFGKPIKYNNNLVLANILLSREIGKLMKESMKKYK
jgi:1-acyl-sn-glycerol-3-phosphate acyltransferase